MNQKSIAIIGAGVAGLATGCYARMNGYSARIFEKESRPGGVCTSWQCGEYTFDGCLQWLLGTRPDSPTHRIWQELGALGDRPVVNHDEFMCIEGRDGRTLHVYANADRFEQQLGELSPADAGVAHALCEAVRRIAALDHSFEHSDWPALVANVTAAIPGLARWLVPTWPELAARFTDRFLRDALSRLFDLPDFPALLGIMILAWHHARDAGYPVGGSLTLAKAIETRYLGLGGEVTYDAHVDEILVQGGRAVGVRLDDGSEYRADIVISCADGHATIFQMLEGRFVDEGIRRQYVAERILKPLVQVSFGVAADFSEQPRALSFPIPKPASIAGQVRDQLTVRHYAYDPTLAPAGKTSLVVLLETDYDWWAELGQDPERYATEKRRVAEAVQEILKERFGALLDCVEQVDVATPVTWERFSGNWRGAYEGWLPTRGAMVRGLSGGLRKTLPGLENFYMVGQWVVPGGGLPGVAPAARALIQRLCAQDGKRFVTSLATPTAEHRQVPRVAEPAKISPNPRPRQSPPEPIMTKSK
ncbi:MAG TPA: NAD(P)/FAD-dependent oxidoreductase [Chloroflexota bacterium]